jgi:uncharacterized protein (DUF2141 family)
MRKLKLIAVLIMMVTVPVSAQYSISGTISGGEPGLAPNIALAFQVGGSGFYYALAVLGSYTISGLDSGDYLVAAFQDLNLNLFPDPGDPYAYYDGNEVVIVTVPPSQTGIDMNLVTPPNDRFYGSITNATAQQGVTILTAYDNCTLGGEPARIDLVRDTTGSGSGPYEFRVDPGTYYLQAHMDRNGDLEPNIGEPYGYYGQPNDPQPISVTPTNWPSGIDVTIDEIPLLPVIDLVATRMDTHLVLSWNPVPFVEVYNIYRGLSPDISPGGLPHASVSDTTWTDPGIVANEHKYFYIVTSTDQVAGD